MSKSTQRKVYTCLKMARAFVDDELECRRKSYGQDDIYVQEAVSMLARIQDAIRAMEAK